MSNIDEELKDLSKRQYAYEEALIKVIDEKQEKIKQLREENERLKNIIEKAIELIKKDREKSYDSLEKKAFYCNKTDKLLNILEGDNKDD